MGSNLLIVDLGSSFIVKQVSAGYAHRCVLSMDGRVKCFGRGDCNSFGDGTCGALGIGSAVDTSNMIDDVPMVDFGVNFN